MEKKEISFGKALFAILLGLIELAFLSLFDNLIIGIMNMLPKFIEAMVSGTLTFGGLFALNYWLVCIFTAKFPSASMRITLSLKKWRYVTIVVLLICVITAVFGFKLIHTTKDTTLPSIISTKPENIIVKSNQFDLPVVYRIFFDDETGLKEVLFDESYVDLEDCTATVTISKINDGECVLSLTNIGGTSGMHQILIKEGAAKDTSNNLSKELLLSPFYLYDTEGDIDSESPLLNIAGVPKTITTNEIIELKITITDNRERISTRLAEKDIVLRGFSADINIDKTKNGYKVRFNNIEVNDKNGRCGFIIVSGVGEDAWGNESKPFISEDFYILSE